MIGVIRRIRSVAFSVVLVAGALVTPALAQQTDGAFGVGVIAGEPTGISAKSWFSDNAAFKTAAGWSFRDETALQLQGDFVWHFADRPHVEEDRLSATFGFGFRFKFADEQELSGLRFPIGVTYDLANSPIELFFEAVPILEFLGNEDLGGNLSAGAHYYFR